MIEPTATIQQHTHRHRTIGLIGGMSWESTALYYRLINQGIRQALGAHHSAHVLLESLNFEPIKRHQHQGDWAAAAKPLVAAAKNLATAGAECLLICTNTMHKIAPAVDNAVDIPLLHLADSTAERIKAADHTTVGFLGTRFSMEDDFYVGRLKEQHNLSVLIPPTADRDLVHQVIYEELCMGKINAASRIEFLRIMTALHSRGAEAIIEGCTEITLLVEQHHTPIPLFDTTTIHAEAAVDFALGKSDA